MFKLLKQDGIAMKDVLSLFEKCPGWFSGFFISKKTAVERPRKISIIITVKLPAGVEHPLQNK